MGRNNGELEGLISQENVIRASEELIRSDRGRSFMIGLAIGPGMQARNLIRETSPGVFTDQELDRVWMTVVALALLRLGRGVELDGAGGG
jgi:hypothetical protein